jgi:5-methylthioribose kinase
MDDVALFAKNQTLTRITVDLVLTDPYRESPRNRWTSPWLDDIAASFRNDRTLKSAAMRMGQRFLTCPQALLHGDLHTGSVMVTQTDTRIIDGEFSLFGPIGFDLGLFMANLLLSLFAHACDPATGAYRDWIVEQAGAVWNAFHDAFTGLWREQRDGGDVMPFALLGEADALRIEQDAMLADIFNDMLGFAGLEMIRRVLGFAHVLDLERIVDARRRACAERAALGFARRLLVERGAFAAIDALMQAAREASLELASMRI